MTLREFGSTPAVLPLMLKAALPALPLIGSLPGIAHRGPGLPDLEYVRTRVSVDTEHLRAYNAVCGFRTGTTLPATYPHMLAFGLQLSMMADASFPFAPMGLVHLNNSITQVRPIDVREILHVSVTPGNLRPHPKGQMVDLVTRVSSGKERVWEETTTLFKRGRADPDAVDDSALTGVEAPAGPVTWRLGSDLGRRYASVSGDHNPIHLFGVTARAFGFPRQIAHGMWTKARSLADLEGRLPDSFTTTVSFRKPVLLPATVHFGVHGDGTGRTVFGVTDGSKGTAHLVGRIERA